MRTQTFIIFALAATILLVHVPAASAQVDEAKRVFDTLYGTKVKAAQATRDPADDVALAGQILEAARNSADQVKLLTMMCDHVYTLGSADPAGYAHAVDAMRLLAATDATRAAAAMDNILELRRKQFARAKADERATAGGLLVDAMLDAADVKIDASDFAAATTILRQALAIARQVKAANSEDVRLRLEQTQARQRVQDRISSLAAKLLKNAGDKAAATELVMLYLVDLDDPRGAMKYADQTGDEKLKQRIPLAAGKPAKHTIRGTFEVRKGEIVFDRKYTDGMFYIPIAIKGEYELRYEMISNGEVGAYGAQLPTERGWAAINFELHRGDALAKGRSGTWSVHMLADKVQVGHAEGNAPEKFTDFPFALLQPRAPHRSTEPMPVVMVKNMTLTFRSIQLRLLNGEAKVVKDAPADPKPIAGETAKAPAGAVDTTKPTEKTLNEGKAVEVLGLVDVKTTCPDGKWEMQRDALVGTPEDGAATMFIPIHFTGDYELTIDWRTTPQTGTATIMLPMPKGYLSFRNTLTLPDTPLSRGQVVTLTVRLKENSFVFSSMFDGKQAPDQEHEYKVLIPRIPGLPDPPGIAVITKGVGVSIKSLRVRVLKGEAKIIKTGG